MALVKLGEVAREYRATHKTDKAGVPIVGLEHLIPEELLFTEYDVDSENTFNKVFKKGQVLFGRRRAYQKKAAVASFDGICSGDITVIEAITGKIDSDLLPFIIENGKFFNYAISGSAGSLSPRVKWEHISEYEFDLPPLSEQKVLAEKLWAAYRLKESYKRMIEATDEMVKSQFIEMFGEKEHNYKTWDELFETKLGKMLDKNKQNPNDNLCPYLANINVQWRTFDLTELNQMTFTDSEMQKFALQEGDLLVCEGGEAGRCAIWQLPKSNIKFQKAIHRARLKTTEIDAHFVQYYMFYAKTSGKLAEYITRGTIEHLTGEKLNQLPIPVPDINLQKKFVSILQQADKSKFELRKSIDAIDTVIKSLIN